MPILVPCPDVRSPLRYDRNPLPRNRERAQLLTVIKLQHKQLTRSRERCRQNTLSSVGGSWTPVRATGLPLPSPPSPCLGAALGFRGESGYQSRPAEGLVRSPPRERSPPPAPPPSPPPLLSTGMLSREVSVTGREELGSRSPAQGSGSGSGSGSRTGAASTTNLSTSNEDTWSTIGPDEEDCFAFSTSERIELLCKVELQREEAAARSRARLGASAATATSGEEGAVEGDESVAGANAMTIDDLYPNTGRDTELAGSKCRARKAAETAVEGRSLVGKSGPATTGSTRPAPPSPTVAHVEKRLQVNGDGITTWACSRPLHVQALFRKAEGFLRLS